MKISQFISHTVLADPPKFITAMKEVLGDISSWMLYIIPAIIIIVLINIGIKIARAEDGMELKEAKKRTIQIIIGSAIAGGATFLSNYLVGKFM